MNDQATVMSPISTLDVRKELTYHQLEQFEKKIFSQNGEDGILQAIFQKIGVTNKFAVEFGAGDATECNTAFLIKYFEWQGLLMDCEFEVKSPDRTVYKERITRENVNAIFKKYKVPKEFDLLSIDVDGNDYWIWEALNYKPRVIVIEYNAHPHWNECVVIDYDPHFQWSGTDYFGASLGALVSLAKQKGYTLVYCESAGVNAFFIRNDLITGHFLPASTEDLYRPPNFFHRNLRHPKDPERTMKPLSEFKFSLRKFFKKTCKTLARPLLAPILKRLEHIFYNCLIRYEETFKNQIENLSSKLDHSMIQFSKRAQNETCIKQLIAQTKEGSFYFDIRDNVVGWNIAYYGIWEPTETNFIKTIIREGDAVIDLGANLGWYSVILGKQVGEKGLVLAFEPDPLNFDLLTKNIALNTLQKQVNIFQSAIMDVNSEISFELSPDNFGDHRPRLYDSNQMVEERLNESNWTSIKVPARTLDSFLSDSAFKAIKHFKLLKIDTQGSEIAIFKGAQKTLQQCQYMIAEFWPYGLKRAGGTIEEWCNLIMPHFDEFSRIGNGLISFSPIEKLMMDIYQPMDLELGPLGYTNYVLRKSHKKARQAI